MMAKALFLWTIPLRGNCCLFLLVPMKHILRLTLSYFCVKLISILFFLFPIEIKYGITKNVHKKNFKCWLNAVANALLATCSERCLLFWITELLNGPVPFPMYSLLWTPWWRRNRMAVWSADVRALAKGNLSLNWISSPRFIFLERSQLPTERWLYLAAVFTGCSGGDPSRRQR